jgi:inosine-uridine nucleoside N-ribohydrolase
VAYQLDNSITDEVSIVSIMGGSITGLGMNHFFSAEFNFALDAHAAKIVIDVMNMLNFRVLRT